MKRHAPAVASASVAPADGMEPACPFVSDVGVTIPAQEGRRVKRAARLRGRRIALPERRARSRRMMSGLAKLAGVVLAAVIFAGALLMVRLSQGPLSFERLKDTVARSLERQFGSDFKVTIDDASVAWESGGPNLAVSGVTIRDPKGTIVVRAPQAEIGFDPWTLGLGNPVPRDISFVGLAVALTIGPDGGVSISASGAVPAGGATAPVAEGGGAGPIQPSDTSFGPGPLLDALTSPNGPIAVLERAGVRGGHLRIDDRRRGKTTDYTDFSLGYVRPQGDAQGRLALSAKGPSGRWSVTLGVTGAPGAERTIRLDTQNLALAEVIAIAQPGAVPFTTDVAISGFLSISVAPDGGIVAVDSIVTSGSGELLIQDPDAKPIRIDGLRGEFGWDRDAHALLVRSLDLKGGGTTWALQGRVVPPGASLDHWSVSLTSSGSQLAGEGGDAPVVIDAITFEGRMPIGLGALFIDRLDMQGPGVAMQVDGATGTAAVLDGLKLNIAASQMPVRKVLAFWPHFITPEVRHYMLDNVVSGTVESFELHNQLSSASLKDALLKKPLPDEAVSIDVKVTNGVMRPAPGLVTLTGIEGKARVTGRTSRIDITRAAAAPSPGHQLLIGKARFEVADTTQKPAIARIGFDVAGGADALLEVLRTDAMRAFTIVPAEVAGVKGQVEARAKVVMPLQPVLAPKDVQVSLQGTTVGLTADNVAGKDRLEAGNLTFAQDRMGLIVKGDAKIGGVPVQIDYQHPSAAPAEVVLLASLDEAARARKGIKLPGQVTGIVDLKATIQDPGSPKSQARVELDLTKAGLVDVVPGWTKAAGKSAKSSFRMVSGDDGTSLEDFMLDAAGGVSARGALRLGEDQGLVSAKFSSLKLSAGDDMKLDIDHAGGVLRAVVRGGAFDARPLLRALMAPGESAFSNPGDVDLDLKVGAIQGLNSETLSGADLKIGLRSGGFKDFRLSGRFGSAPLSGQVARLEGGMQGIVVETGDGGSFLRFFDIYRRMLGGELLVTLTGPGPRMDGTLIVNRFVLSNEPALAKSAPLGQKADGLEAPNNVLFTKLRSGFSVGGGKLVISEATMWGQSVGGTLDGTLDFTRDQANLSGTFVPAYGLNNIFNRVPVVGPILGGGQNEGLFAVNFRISGKVSQPTLSINPLSAVAPGFLRKFFGVFNADQATGGGDALPPSRTTDTPR